MADPVSRRPIPSFFIDSILRRDSPGRSASLRSALTSGDDDDDDDGGHEAGGGGDGSSGGGGEGCRGGGGGSAGGGDSDDSDSDPGGSQRPGQRPGLPALQFPPQLAGEPGPRSGAGYAPLPPLTPPPPPPPHLLLHRADAGRPPPPAPPPLTSRYPIPVDSAALGPHHHRRVPDNYHHRVVGVAQTGSVGLGLGLGGGGVGVGVGGEELPPDTDVLEACCLDSGCPEYGPGHRVATAGHPGNYGTEVLIADGLLHCDGGGGRGEERLPAGDGGIGLPRDEPKQPEVVSDLGDDGKKRPRTAFSADQVRSLEQEFQRSKYLSVSKRTEMSRQLGLTEQQIKIWFQNRRTKWKRKYTNNLEILAQQHYLRMGLLPAYPFNPPGGATKPVVGTGFGGGGMFGGPGLGGRPQLFPGPQSAVRLYSPFSNGPALPRM